MTILYILYFLPKKKTQAKNEKNILIHPIFLSVTHKHTRGTVQSKGRPRTVPFIYTCLNFSYIYLEATHSLENYVYLTIFI